MNPQFNSSRATFVVGQSPLSPALSAAVFSMGSNNTQGKIHSLSDSDSDSDSGSDSDSEKECKNELHFMLLRKTESPVSSL